MNNRIKCIRNVLYARTIDMIMKLCYTHTANKNEQTEQVMYYNKLHDDDGQILPTPTPERFRFIDCCIMIILFMPSRQNENLT